MPNGPVYENILKDHKDLLTKFKLAIEGLPSDGAAFKLCDYLCNNKQFIESPASRNYHHCYYGGLLEHCYEVAQNLHVLAEAMKLTLTREEIFILAFGHDLQKVGHYEIYYRNVKNDITNIWNKVEAYKDVEDKIAVGHELGAIYRIESIVNGVIPLRLRRAIFYHMGAFGGNPGDYGNACQQDMLVLALHTADMMSVAQNKPKLDAWIKERGYER